VGHALLLEEVFGGYCARGGGLLHAMENVRTRRETCAREPAHAAENSHTSGLRCTVLQMKIQPTLRTGVMAMSSVAIALLQW
jgi:hypothetical protein